MKTFFFTILLSSSLIFAVEGEDQSEVDISKISEGLGYMIGKNLENLGIPLDIHRIAKGMHEALQGTDSPISEDECYQALSILQENEQKKIAKKNLYEAEAFLAKNGKENGVFCMEEGKIQYRILQNGKGSSVQPYNSPLIRYVGKYLDGNEFGSSTDVELVSLDETIDGFRKGLIGMKEGEKRIVYIHPDFGYGNSSFFPPNSLLTFEIEVMKADATHSSKKSSVKNAKAQTEGEVASILDDEKMLR